jgi:signal transduction histidine kinase
MVVLLHGGTIEVTSEEGRGTTVRLRLPRDVAVPQATAAT